MLSLLLISRDLNIKSAHPIIQDLQRFVSDVPLDESVTKRYIHSISVWYVCIELAKNDRWNNISDSKYIIGLGLLYKLSRYKNRNQCLAVLKFRSPKARYQQSHGPFQTSGEGSSLPFLGSGGLLAIFNVHDI